MAYARSTNVEVGADFAVKALVERLRVEYTIQKGRFSLLKDDVIQLQYTVEKMCGECMCSKENQLTADSVLRLMLGVSQVKGRLSELMTEIRLQNTDESQEYRYCKAILNESERRYRCQPMKNEHYHLIESIVELRNMYEDNCKAKEDLENIINRAHHQLNKLEKLLAKYEDLSEPNMEKQGQQTKPSLVQQEPGTCGLNRQKSETRGLQHEQRHPIQRHALQPVNKLNSVRTALKD